MSDQFQYDVFLSHSSKDKVVVRAVAERLRADGLRVWLDDWAQLACPAVASVRRRKAGTFRFRDPLNKERRFIPLRLDDAPIRGSLA
ncbi:MAG: toll/interleukin-1 receptor domain-containing protein [Verrucomicrobiia bacterium]|jgi:hypothetical protein